MLCVPPSLLSKSYSSPAVNALELATEVKVLSELDKCDDTCSTSSSIDVAFDVVEDFNADTSNDNVSYTSSSAASLRHVGDGPSTSPQPNEAETLPNGRLTLRDRIIENIGNWLDQVADAFAETNEDENSNSNMNSQSKPAEPEKLSARALRRDIRRCLNCSKPYLQTWVVLHDLLIWKDPLTSLMAFFIYAHMFYTGHLWPTFLGLILLQLFFNYLTTQKKIKVGLYFMPRQDIEPPRFDRSGVSLIFDIAYKGQILFHFLANCLEKVNNLFMWKRPETTKQFCIFVGFFFTMSLICCTSTCLLIIGLVVGLKTFIVVYIYHRFPRLRNKLDVLSFFYLRTPTNLDKPSSQLSVPQVQITESPQNNRSNDPFNSKLRASYSLRNMSIMSSVLETAMLQTTRKRSNTTGSYPGILDDYEFNSKIANQHQEQSQNTLKPLCETSPKSISIRDLRCGSSNYMLSESVEEEVPPVHYILERSCVLVDRNKSFKRRLNFGTLLLTETEMLFKHSLCSSSGHILNGNANEIICMPYDEVQKITKVHCMTPWPGRAIEVRLESKRKPLQFVGITKRDEFFDTAIELASQAGVNLSIS